MYKAPTRITTTAYKALGSNPRRKLSKTDQERLAAGLDPIPLEEYEAEVLSTALRRAEDLRRPGCPGVLWFTHIPNETRTTPGVAKKLKRQGVRKGKCDYEIYCQTPRDGTIQLNIELKRISGGTVSKEQKEYIELASSVPGVFAHVAKGASEALSIISKYI